MRILYKDGEPKFTELLDIMEKSNVSDYIKTYTKYLEKMFLEENNELRKENYKLLKLKYESEIQQVDAKLITLKVVNQT